MSEFDPIPIGAGAARIFGRATAVIAAGRKPRRRVANLMIAAIAVVEELPLSTTNPDDFTGQQDVLTVVPATRPRVPQHHPAGTSADQGRCAGGIVIWAQSMRERL